MDQILEFVYKSSMPLIPVLYIIGMVLKATPKVANWFIPWALMFGGIVLSILVNGFSLDNILQGVMVAGMAVYAHQLYKQTGEKRAQSGADQSKE